MSEWTKLPRPQCEAVAQMPMRHTYPDGGPPYRCIRAAEWRHEASGRLVCWQHRAAMEYRKKPVEFISANAGAHRPEGARKGE